MIRPLSRRPTQLLTLATALSVALAFCVPVVSASMLDRVTVYGFEIRQSRGSKLSHHVMADMSRMAPDDAYSVIAENPVCRVILKDEQTPVAVTSARLRYYFRGYDMAPAEGDPIPELPVDVIRQWNGELIASDDLPRYSDPSRGDILFSSAPDSERVYVDLGERGELRATHLLWTEEFQRFVALGGFEQRTVNERGDRIRTSGMVFTADESFQNISYHVIGDETIDIEIE